MLVFAKHSMHTHKLSLSHTHIHTGQKERRTFLTIATTTKQDEWEAYFAVISAGMNDNRSNNVCLSLEQTYSQIHESIYECVCVLTIFI